MCDRFQLSRIESRSVAVATPCKQEDLRATNFVRAGGSVGCAGCVLTILADCRPCIPQAMRVQSSI